MTLERRCALLGAALLLGQLALVLLPGELSPWTALGAPAAIGAALVPWLPAEVRRRPLAVVALVVPLGCLVLSIAVTGIGAVGVPLTAATVLALVAVAVIAGVLGERRTAPADTEFWSPWTAAALAGVVATSIVLALLANDSTPFSGNDWAKYLLYADQAREQGDLLIENRFWLLGQPFREDPGLPALYTALLLLSDGPAAGLIWGAAVMMVLSALAVFAFADVLFGGRAAAFAALAFAVAPAGADMSAWHGAANMWGLVVLPVVLLGAGALLRGWTSTRWVVLGATAFVALVCAHRLTMSIAAVALALLAAGAVVVARRAAVVVLARVALAGLVVGALPAVDLLTRQGDAGGLLPYTAYLQTKLDWGFVARDLTWALCAAGLVALVLAVRRARRGDAVAWMPLALLAGVMLYAYGWVLHLPGFYARAAYFLPLVAAVAIAAAARSVPRLVPVGIAVLALAWVQAPQVADDAGEFYRFTDRAALRGYDLLLEERKPGEVVVTDRCTSFLGTYLLQVPILAGLRDEEVGPAAELPRVRQAQQIIDGGPRGAQLVEELDARWLVVNANCPGELIRPPEYARTRYVSNLLIVYRLEPNPRA